MNVVRSCLKIANDSAHTKWICPLLLLADAGLTGLVIWKIPCKGNDLILALWSCNTDQVTDTEIDWKAYMQQVQQFIAGERDYTKIYGGTGPLVYPASHVYIYQWLYNVTDQGHDIRLAQIIFGALYLATLALAMACYRNAKVGSAGVVSLVLDQYLIQTRFPPMSSRYWSCQSVCTQSLSFAVSTIAGPFSSYSWPYTASRSGCGRSGQLCTRSA